MGVGGVGWFLRAGFGTGPAINNTAFFRVTFWSFGEGFAGSLVGPDVS